MVPPKASFLPLLLVLNACTDLGNVESMLKERWGAAKWMKGKLRIYCANDFDAGREPADDVPVLAKHAGHPSYVTHDVFMKMLEVASYVKENHHGCSEKNTSCGKHQKNSTFDRQMTTSSLLSGFFLVTKPISWWRNLVWSMTSTGKVALLCQMKCSGSSYGAKRPFGDVNVKEETEEPPRKTPNLGDTVACSQGELAGRNRVCPCCRRGIVMMSRPLRRP